MYVYIHVCVCKQNEDKNKITKTALHDIQANYRVPFNTGTAYTYLPRLLSISSYTVNIREMINN